LMTLGAAEQLIAMNVDVPNALSIVDSVTALAAVAGT
jgi:hypothetical protein